MNINPKFKIGERVLIPAGTKTGGTTFLRDTEGVVSDIQISITKNNISIRYHLEKERAILKEKGLRKIEQ